MLNTNEKNLKKFKQQHLLRHRRTIQDRFELLVKVENQWAIHFCSNDYLNLAIHPEVKKSFAKAAMHFGLGSCSSNLVSGYHQSHRDLECAMAEFFGRDRALLFNSGYHANIGVFQTFANRCSVVIADKLCHASLLDGIVGSRAKHYRYAHQDYAEAGMLLEKHQQKSCLMATESVFSMEGDITNLPLLSALARKKQAMLVVDDAHGLTVLGPAGQGACHYFNLTQEDVPVLVSPLGKGLGGLGAIVSGSAEVIENLLQFARTYRYTISLPPAISAAALTALQILQKETWRQEQLRHLSIYFNLYAKNLGLTLFSDDPTPIRSILIGDNQKTIFIQNKLLEKGFLVSNIRPPTVPLHTARLRISLNALHTEVQIAELLQHIKQLLKD